MTVTNSPVNYPVLPLRDIVVFPNMIVPLFVGRKKSVEALEAAMDGNRQILLLTQKTAKQDDPTKDDVYDVGVIATILQLLKLPDGTVKVLVEGLQRATLVRFVEEHDYLEASATLLQGDESDDATRLPTEEDDEEDEDNELVALSRAVITQFEHYLKLNKRIPPEVLVSINQIGDADRLADTITAHLSLKIAEKQEILEAVPIKDRLELVFAALESEISVMNTEKRIRGRVKKQMEKTQRDYYLNEQMKAIQKELGDEQPTSQDEIKELEKRIKATKLTKEAKDKAKAELKKLKVMPPMAAEATVIRNYLDWILSVPWSKIEQTKHTIDESETMLDEQHYGLEKVKERVLEYLAVQQRSKKLSGPILCLVGPPGVGKTSLGKAIAEAAGRKFVRMSVGGVRDESEIRGHRRTYIGSMPGKVLQGMKKAKTSNPLFLIDEIDKMGNDFRGDPASALLEVLDPEQNNSFNDHYLEVDYDLSQVMFVCTANTLNMPQPLLDRMEIIRLSGYTEDEKVEIAHRHLLKRQAEANGLEEGEWDFQETALRDIIRYYTREAGVRGLEKEIAKVGRKVTKQLVSGDKQATPIVINSDNIGDYLGVRKHRYGIAEEEHMVGVVTGLAWTEVGGELLTIEALKLPGKGTIKTTGKLGEVMQESIQAASSYVRSRAASYGVQPDAFEKLDIHVHVPEGATPKDGPSAGTAMCVSIVSVLTGIPIRKDIAMTGETTLRGRVLPIGGLKEKLLAALRGGIKTVLIPEENVKDLAEIPDKVKNGLEIIPVSGVEQVLRHALIEPLVPLTADELLETARGVLPAAPSLKGALESGVGPVDGVGYH